MVAKLCQALESKPFPHASPQFHSVCVRLKSSPDQGLANSRVLGSRNDALSVEYRALRLVQVKI